MTSGDWLWLEIMAVVCIPLWTAFGIYWLRQRLRLRRYNDGVRHMEPPCHVVGCNGRVTHSHWPQDDPYDVQYFCPRHTSEHMERERTYAVEPWMIELSDKAIHSLLHSEYTWAQRARAK